MQPFSSKLMCAVPDACGKHICLGNLYAWKWPQTMLDHAMLLSMLLKMCHANYVACRFDMYASASAFCELVPSPF